MDTCLPITPNPPNYIQIHLADQQYYSVDGGQDQQKDRPARPALPKTVAGSDGRYGDSDDVGRSRPEMVGYSTDNANNYESKELPSASDPVVFLLGYGSVTQ